MQRSGSPGVTLRNLQVDEVLAVFLNWLWKFSVVLVAVIVAAHYAGRRWQTVRARRRVAATTQLALLASRRC